jgi:hypothetical protein
MLIVSMNSVSTKQANRLLYASREAISLGNFYPLPDTATTPVAYPQRFPHRMNALEWRATLTLGAIYALRMRGRTFVIHDPAGVRAGGRVTA